jgi:adenosylhomocysteine nucleosidase
MKKIILVFAMQAELDAFKSQLKAPTTARDGYEEIQDSNQNIRLVLTGITMLNCYKLQRHITDFKPDLVMQIGTCAGLRKQNIGDVIHAQTFFNADLDLTTFQRPLGRLYAKEKVKMKHPVLVSGSKFLDSEESAANVVQQFEADAFDMESFGFYTICEQQKIPFTSIRGVSDNGQSNANTTFEMNLKKAATAAAIATLQYLKTIA